LPLGGEKKDRNLGVKKLAGPGRKRRVEISKRGSVKQGGQGYPKD